MGQMPGPDYHLCIKTIYSYKVTSKLIIASGICLFCVLDVFFFLVKSSLYFLQSSLEASSDHER